jgi:PKD repeat protein
VLLVLLGGIISVHPVGAAEVLNNTGFEWGFFSNETWIAWGGMNEGTGTAEVTSTDKYSGAYSAILFADDDVEGGGYGIAERLQNIKGYETSSNVTNVSFLYKLVESTGDSYAYAYVYDTWPPTNGIRTYTTDCNWTRVVYDVSGLDPEIGPWTFYFGANSGESGGSVTVLFDDITTDGSTPSPSSDPTPTPTPTPPPPGTGQIHWQKAVENTGINQDYVRWVVHNTELWLIDCYNGIIYNSTDGFNYNTLNSDPDPWNATINPYYSGRLYPEILEFNNSVWVIGGRYGYNPINDTWYSSDGVSWSHVAGDPWGGTLASRIGFGAVDYDNKMWAIGGEVVPALSDISATHNTATGLTNPWTLLGTAGYIGGMTTALSRDDGIYALAEGTYLYKTTNGINYTYISAPSVTTGTRGVYYGSWMPQHQFFLDYNNAMWVLGAGYGNGYFSSNNGTTWSLDRAYTEYPNIAQSASFVAFDGSLLPEVLFSYDPVGDDIWYGGYISQAEFNGSPTSGQYNLSVTFTDLSTNSPTDWFWQFGDGYNSTEQNPTHIYTYPGTFDVSLVANNSYGYSATVKTDYITVADQLGVGFWGHVYDALTNESIADANVSFLQSGVYHNTTTNVSGGYVYGTEFAKDLGINATAEKSGYTPWPAYFWVNANGTYEYDLYLIPEFNTTSDTWIGGFVYDDLWVQGISGATVNIWNDTWSDTNTTLATGFYLFTNLTNTTYNINATYFPLFDNSSSYSILGVYENFTQQDIPLSPNYQIDLEFKDGDTMASIYSNITVILMDVNTSSVVAEDFTTTASWSSGLIDYGYYNVTVSCENYSTEYADITLYSNVSGTIYLYADENFDGANTNYVPHPVRFTYVDAYGNPITGATVTATALESTNPWSWLEEVFGFSSTVDIQGTVLSGTTGSDGTLSFMMIETIEYRVNCIKASAGINHSVDIYPKNTEYFIRIGSLPSVGPNYPSYSLNATTVGTNVILFGNYTDTSGETSAVRFIVVNSTGSEVYNTSVTLTGGVGSAYYAVNNTKGDQLTFGLVAEHDTHGTIQKWIDITLKGSGRLINFGEGWTDFMYMVMAIAGIFLVGGCFGEMDVRLGAIFIPMMGAIFWWIGWLPETYGAVITIAGFLGAIYYIRSKAKELDT